MLGLGRLRRVGRSGSTQWNNPTNLTDPTGFVAARAASSAQQAQCAQQVGCQVAQNGSLNYFGYDDDGEWVQTGSSNEQGYSNSSDKKNVQTKKVLVPQISAVSDKGEINFKFLNKGALRYEKVGDEEFITVEGFIDDRDSKQGKAFVKAVNSAWSGTIKNEHSKLTIKTQLQLATNDEEKKKAIAVLINCDKSDCPSKVTGTDSGTTTERILGRAPVGGYSPYIRLAPLADAKTYAHEWGHYLGLHHSQIGRAHV